jgi:flagellar motility protein MotE (MotC chaperone)
MSALKAKKRPRIARLLPGVIALGAVVLVLKSTDLVHDAYAQAAGQVAALTDDPVPANKDFAGGDDDQVASASEVDVVNSLAKRRRELDTREGQLNTQANVIAAAEARVDAKISQLKLLQAQINALLVQRDQAQKDQIASLVKTYSGMKPAAAAAIFGTMPDEVLVPVAQAMKPDTLGDILSKMSPNAAQQLTVKLASKLTLPQTTDAIAPQTAQPAPGPVAALTPAPAATAAPAADQPAPVKKRARKPRPATEATASATPATAPAATAPAQAAASAPASAAATPAAAASQ